MTICGNGAVTDYSEIPLVLLQAYRHTLAFGRSWPHIDFVQ